MKRDTFTKDNVHDLVDHVVTLQELCRGKCGRWPISVDHNTISYTHIEMIVIPVSLIRLCGASIRAHNTSIEPIGRDTSVGTVRPIAEPRYWLPLVACRFPAQIRKADVS